MAETHSLQNQHLNRLRAAVLGANDGIVSTSSVVMGVAGAGASNNAIFTAGLAALVAGALSMAVGEYVSVASQKDAEKAHFDSHHKGNDEDHEYSSPMQAAVASLLSFVAGGLVPFIAVVITPEEYKIVATVAAVLVALILTGYFSANAGKSSRTKAVIRVVIGGSVAMLVTYYVGSLFGANFLG
jgi:vacuolar iron transporter family protein